ncbi:hypothetical protein [Pseudoalteromonas ruthenica]|uniref:hypothetical protein n=1 Tax=Pseudoalteromonas ruthenica TaxID=151081 RepID=UPI00110BE245|nr:hypothetical protein [Pseudoalteromonas ruthenica]TMO97574.1 hypothetical protein CWC07_13920 [Pseudoalteromonas ruthenica]
MAQHKYDLGSEKLKNAAELSPDVTVKITGRFLIEQGLDEKWLRLRKKALHKNPTLVGGIITEHFIDELFITQARSLGVIF